MEFSTAYYYPLFLTILGCSLIGCVSGLLGTFALLKKQSLLGDTIAHASLPGIILALLITQTKQSDVLLLGGAIAGSIGVALTMLIKKYTTLKNDTILGIILSVFFGFGLLLLSQLQKYNFADQALINKFLFGNASIILISDMYLLGIICTIIMLICFLFWKEFVLNAFDPAFTHTIGFSSTIINMIFTCLLVITIVIGLQSVGVILMSSLLIAPAACARQWSSHISQMMFISGSLGILATVLGGCASNFLRLPTGPLIVVILSCCVFCSLIFAPKRTII